MTEIAIEITVVNTTKAAAILGVNRKTVYRWVRSGRLVPIKGTKTLFLLDHVKAVALPLKSPDKH